MELGDKHQTTPREATNDPGNDNINALKNAHLTPRAIKAIQSGKDIKNEDSVEDSTTDGRKPSTPSPQKKRPAAPVKRQQLATPKPVRKKNVSTQVSKPAKAPVRAKSTPKPVTKSTSTKPKEKTSSRGTGTAYVTLLDMINAGVNT
jgi:hypothetical protein